MTKRAQRIAAQDGRSPSLAENLSAGTSRRRALAAMIGAASWLPAASAAPDPNAPVRLALSESMFGDVNRNDAQAAMQIWINVMTKDLNLVLDTRLFCTTQEIYTRIRKGDLDSMAINVVEYRPIADLLDSSQVIAAGGEAGLEQYVVLVKQNGGIRRLADLKGRRLLTLKSPKMCVASEWLFSILEEGHHGTAEEFFGSIAANPKFSRVVLPVFFGQADACLTSKRGFDTMCELNPQVAQELKVIASSPPMVVNFYIFHKNFQGPSRNKVVRALSSLRSSVSGRQLATLFQFEQLAVRDASCLTNALSVLDAADRARSRQGAGSPKG